MLNVKSGVITSGTTGAIVLNGFGFTPEFFMVFGVGPSAGGFAGGLARGFGMTDGTFELSRFAYVGFGLTSFNAQYNMGRICFVENNFGTDLLHYEFTSFDADGVTLQCTTSQAGWHIHWIAFGGSGFQGVGMEISTAAPTTGNLVVSGLAFGPTFLMGMNGISQWVGFSFAAKQSPIMQHISAALMPPVAGASECDRLLVVDKYEYALTGPSGSVTRDVPLTSFNGDGVTFNRITNSVTGFPSPTLLGKAPTTEMVEFLQPTSPGMLNVPLSIVKNPKLIIFHSISAEYDATPNSMIPDENLALGYATGSFAEGIDSFGCVGSTAGDNRGGGTQNASQFSSVAKVLSLFSATAPSVVADAEISIPDLTSFDLDFTTADATARFIRALVIGELAGVVTEPITSIGPTTAVSGGDIEADATANITQKGVCWDTSPGPTTSDSLTNDGAGDADYVSNLSGLLPLTTYYVRAYIIEGGDTHYGQELSFITTDTPTSGFAGGLMMLGVGN